MAEPLIVIRHRSTHEWRLENWNWRIGDPMTWTLHFLMDGTANYVRCADEHETALLNECKRLVDAAHGVPAPGVPFKATLLFNGENRVVEGVIRADARGVSVPDPQTKT